MTEMSLKTAVSQSGFLNNKAERGKEKLRRHAMHSQNIQNHDRNRQGFTMRKSVYVTK